MAVNDVGLEVDLLEHRQYSLIEKYKFFNIIPDIPIRHHAVEILLIVDKVILDTVHLISENANILILDICTTVHIKMCHIFTLIAKMLRNAAIKRNHYTDIPILLVKLLRQCTTYICQTTRFNKRNTFRCCK